MHRPAAHGHLVLVALLLAAAACSGDRDQGESDTVDPDVQEDATDDAVEDPGDDVREDPADDADADDADAEPRPICVPSPTAEALLPPGSSDGDAVLGLGGRGLSTFGVTTEVEGFPSNAVVRPAGDVAYVLTSSRGERRLIALDTEDGAIVQDIDMPDVFYGIALHPDGSRLYVSGGATRDIHGYAVAEDGTLTLTRTLEVDTFTSGIDVAPDGSRIFVGSFSGPRVLEIDTDAFAADEEERPETAVVGDFLVGQAVWAVQYVPGRDEVVASTLQGEKVVFLDRATGTVRAELELGLSPMGMALSGDEATLWVAVSGADALVEIDVATATVTRTAEVAELDLVDAEGERLTRSNTNDVALSPDGERLYVTRGGDNAVSVFARDGLELLGSFPTTWYPTCVTTTPDGATVVVCEGRGFGADADTVPDRRDTMDGNVSFVGADIDLEASTAAVTANYNRARLVFPFECDEGFFPVPTRPDVPSPIEHVILIVKENKTFDCVFGDLTDMDVDVDPTLVRWGEEITPNQHALARQFNISDNFHVEAENSDMGHIVLTSGTLTDFIERMWFEVKRGSQSQGYQMAESATPPDGNLFTHLMDHGVDIRVYGEIVGMFEFAADGTQPIAFSDPNYPGGIYYNMNARDSARAEYVLERIAEDDFASFTFILFPNDHTGGVAPGNPTPEAEVADNDEAVGILIDGLSRTDYWGSTAVFIVQDDPQGCSDHVDSHRSAAMVISPWARRGYVSHVNASFQSVFATITRILGVPPMGRHDASASPMWDMFTGEPDYSPFDRLPRTVPEEKILDRTTPGIDQTLRMDFRGPDRNPELGVVLDAYRLWRMGRIDRDEANRRIADGIRSMPAAGPLAPEVVEEIRDELEEEAEEEVFAYDLAFEQYAAWLAERGQTMPRIDGAPLPEETIRAFMEGRAPIEAVQRFNLGQGVVLENP